MNQQESCQISLKLWNKFRLQLKKWKICHFFIHIWQSFIRSGNFYFTSFISMIIDLVYLPYVHFGSTVIFIVIVHLFQLCDENIVQSCMSGCTAQWSRQYWKQLPITCLVNLVSYLIMRLNITFWVNTKNLVCTLCDSNTMDFPNFAVNLIETWFSLNFVNRMTNVL